MREIWNRVKTAYYPLWSAWEDLVREVFSQPRPPATPPIPQGCTCTRLGEHRVADLHCTYDHRGEV